MTQYIDKSALVAEIEKRRSRNSKNKLNLAAAFEDNYLLSFIDTLEVKEVQEEPVSEEFINALGTMLNDGLPDRYLVSEERIKKSAELLFSIARKQLKNEMQEWSEEDENMLKSIIATCELAEQDRDSSPARHLFEMQANWLKSLKDRVQPQSKQEWSEEDINKPNGGIVMEDFNDGNGFYKVNLAYLNEEQVEEIEELVKRWGLQPKEDEDESIVSDLLDYFDEDKCLKHEVNDIVKWLKTIKPQQKGCGENEIKMLDNLITYLDGRKDLLEEIKSTYIDWLKSLKDKYTWKPSDEQMEALKDAKKGVFKFGILESLYNDLKKLKGE